MAVYILPSGVIHELESLFRKFLWAQGDDPKGKCRVAWDMVCKPLDEGGLGFKRLAYWNRALVAKHAWDLIVKRPSLWVKWVHQHYIRDSCFWSIRYNARWSWLIRNILDLKPHIRMFFFHRLGDGRSTRAWEDRWLWCGPLALMISYRHFRAAGFDLQSTARDVILGCNGVWPETWRNDAAQLASEGFPTLHDLEEDTVWWCKPDRTLVSFSVKDAWNSMVGLQTVQVWTRYIWFKGCIPKHAFCVWLAFQKRLPTQDRIKNWKTDPPDLKCTFCGTCPDSHDHLFFRCQFSAGIWSEVKREVQLGGFADSWSDITETLSNNNGPRRTMQLLAIQATVYSIWMERNRRIFLQKNKNADQICKIICDGVMMWMAWKHRMKTISNVHGV